MKIKDVDFHKLSDILGRWRQIAPEHPDIRFVKMLLMPKDDPDQIVLKVTDHPGIELYDVQVYDKEYLEEICNIVISCITKNIVYDFDLDF